MNLYVVVRTKYDKSGMETNKEIFDSDSNVLILIERSKEKLEIESREKNFSGYYLQTERVEGEFRNQKSLCISYKDGTYREYYILDVKNLRIMNFNYEEYFAELVGSNLISFESKQDEVTLEKSKEFNIKNIYTLGTHGISKFEIGSKKYTTLCGIEGTHFEEVYKDSVGISCEDCLKIEFKK